MVKRVYNKSYIAVNVGGLKIGSKQTLDFTEDMINENVLKALKHLEQMNLISIFEKDAVEEKPIKKSTKKNKK